MSGSDSGSSSQPPVYVFGLEKVGSLQVLLKQMTGTTSSDDKPISYTIHGNKAHPEFRVTDSHDERIANAEYFTLSSKIDLVLRGERIELRKSLLSVGHSFSHPSFNKDLTWKVTWKGAGLMSGGLVLRSGGRDICSFKEGRGFEVHEPLEREGLEVVLFTGLAVVGHKQRGEKQGGVIYVSDSALGGAFGVV